MAVGLVVAVDENWAIGRNGDLLQHIPEDLKFFKTLTSGHTVIMGRNTWESLPKKPLPNRLNVVITYEKEEPQDNVIFVSLDEAIKIIESTAGEEKVFVIGGGMIYKELLPYCNEAWVTKIYKIHDDADTFFPNLDEMSDYWELDFQDAYRSKHKDVEYQFQHYSRVFDFK